MTSADDPCDFTQRLARQLLSIAGPAIVGVYLHGSAALGDWQAHRSDVDVLVVVDDGLIPRIAEDLAGVLARAQPPECPGTGLECTVVAARAARSPQPPWPFIVHVTTPPDDCKTIWCAPGKGDDDLVLHYLDARANGRAVHGPPPSELIGALDPALVRRALANELRWGVDHASYAYAVLNACRALRYATDAEIGSKTAGGEWALARDIEPALVRSALDQRVQGARRPVDERARAWVLDVVRQLVPAEG